MISTVKTQNFHFFPARPWWNAPKDALWHVITLDRCVCTNNLHGFTETGPAVSSCVRSNESQWDSSLTNICQPDFAAHVLRDVSWFLNQRFCFLVLPSCSSYYSFTHLNSWPHVYWTGIGKEGFTIGTLEFNSSLHQVTKRNQHVLIFVATNPFSWLTAPAGNGASPSGVTCHCNPPTDTAGSPVSVPLCRRPRCPSVSPWPDRSRHPPVEEDQDTLALTKHVKSVT